MQGYTLGECSANIGKMGYLEMALYFSPVTIDMQYIHCHAPFSHTLDNPVKINHNFHPLKLFKRYLKMSSQVILLTKERRDNQSAMN
jgi:hypothetical protein